jgi:hypothetical protein
MSEPERDDVRSRLELLDGAYRRSRRLTYSRWGRRGLAHLVGVEMCGSACGAAYRVNAEVARVSLERRRFLGSSGVPALEVQFMAQKLRRQQHL